MTTTINEGPSLSVHPVNRDVAEAVEAQARRLGFETCRNHSGARKCNFDGYHRYLVFDPRVDSADRSCRSRACVSYAEARFSRSYLPSQKGEREALEALLERLVARKASAGN